MMDAIIEEDTNNRPTSEEEVIRTYWGDEKLALLLKIVKQNHVRLLPPLWKRLALASQHGLQVLERVTIENHIVGIANSLNLANSVPFITPELARKIVSFEFAGDDLEDLDEGINPFSLVVKNEGDDIAYENTTDMMLARLKIRNHDNQVATKGYMIRVADLRLVSDWKHVTTLLEAQYIILVALLGHNHLVVNKYQHFLHKYKADKDHYNEHLMNGYLCGGYKYRHAIILRFVQETLYNWFHPFFSPNLREMDVHAVDFDYFLRCINEGHSWMDYATLPFPYDGWHFTDAWESPNIM